MTGGPQDMSAQSYSAMFASTALDRLYNSDWWVQRLNAFLGPQELQNFHIAVVEACKRLLAIARPRGAMHVSIASPRSTTADDYAHDWHVRANLTDVPPEQWQRYEDSRGVEWLCVLDSAGEVAEWFYTHSPGEWKCFQGAGAQRWWWHPAMLRWFHHP